MDDSTKPTEIPLICKFHVLGLEVVQYSNANMLQDDLSTIQDGWGKSSEWVNSHG